MQRSPALVRRLVAATALLATVFTGSALPAAGFEPPYAPTFPDVPKTHTFYAQIEWLVAEDITTGFSDGTFRPSSPLTRQAIAAFIYRYEEGSKAPRACNSAPFTDVPKNHQFCGQIKWAKDKGVVQGYPDGSFRPTGTVARQGLVVFLYRLAGSPNGANPSCPTKPFSDVATSHAFCGEIRWAKQTGVVKGFTDGTFKPSRPVTRQAFASNLYNYDDLFGVSSMAALGADPDDVVSGPTDRSPAAEGSSDGVSPTGQSDPGTAPGDAGTTGAASSEDAGTVPGPSEDAASATAVDTPTVVATGNADGFTLPLTGSNIAGVVIVALLLVGGGVLLVVATRRRHSS